MEVIKKIEDYKNKRILMVCPNENDYWARETAKQNKNVDIFTLYKSCNKLLRLIRRIFVKLRFSIRPFLAPWYKNMHNYDMIIIDANIINCTLPNWLRKNQYEGRIIYWYWNPVQSCVNPKIVDRGKCELWSFDPDDCAKYDMRLNTQYYFPTFKTIDSKNVKYDIFFVGREKGRLAYLTELEKQMNESGLNTYFHIVKRDEGSNKKNTYKSLISYEEILKYIGESRAILDVVQEGQTGQTLRAMEALFFSKKLITNNKSIINCDFYRKENIFVLGVDDIQNIQEFIEIPFNPIEKNILDKYEFNQWVERF